jgi:molybdenum cofactor cytidylyltransferase
VIAALILAAGASTRMGANKLLIEGDDGRALVAGVADAAIEAGLNPVVVVTGHDADSVRAVLAGCPVRFVHNQQYKDGLASSLKTGIATLPDTTDGALICLGDMPDVTAQHMARIVAAFDPEKGAAVCVPTRQGKRGNPVLFGRRYFAEMMTLSGDVGARGLIAAHKNFVIEVPMDDDAVLTDMDTAEDLAAYRNRT